jgi:predicted  nucleic acid-binding Zn-ribbon protein
MNDKALREHYCFYCGTYGSMNAGQFCYNCGCEMHTYPPEIEKVITQAREQAAVEARIDELENMTVNSRWTKDGIYYKTPEERIKILKHQTSEEETQDE